MAGWTKGTDNSCTANATDTGAPCSSGYYRVANNDTCVQCKDGCARCSAADTCDACNEGVMWTQSSTTQCDFDCPVTCAVTGGTYECGASGTAAVNKVQACKNGWQYNGVSFSCEMTNPAKTCPQPASDSNVYFFDATNNKCSACMMQPNCA